MNAKEATPVEDASALVPFGWAPGGYHCAACSTCGEAHSGSDKRSARCQDCAEALRDKQAVEPAPTTRETADHAELADELRAFEGSDDLGNGDFTVCEFAADAIENLLSEIAALRGSLSKANSGFEEYERKFYLEQDAREQAERQRDEAVGLLRDTVQPSGLYETGGASIAEKLNAIRAFLANQGADQ